MRLAAARPARRTPAGPSARSAPWRWRGRRGSAPMCASVLPEQYQSRSWPPGTPAAPVVLADAHLGVRRAVGALDVAERTPDRQLPAHVGLGLDEVHALPQGEVRAARSRTRPRSRGSWGRCSARRPTRVLRSPSSSVSTQPLRRTRPRLPIAWSASPSVVVEPLHPLGDPLLVVLVGEVGAERAAPGVRGRRVDAGAALAEDAGPARRQPRQVAAEHLLGVGRIGELDPRRGKTRSTSGTSSTLVAARGTCRGR